MKKPCILVVDDDAALRELITLRLEANGFRVEAVDSGETALAQLARTRPDAVLTDMQMAGMDGMALFRAIHTRDPALPVIRADRARTIRTRGRHPAGAVRLSDQTV